jgi:hypothetical protein
MRIIYQLPDGSRAGEMIAVNYFIPYDVNDAQSDIRGIKCGWYTMDECGRLGSGPFSTASECRGIGSQAKKVETEKWLHRPLQSPINPGPRGLTKANPRCLKNRRCADRKSLCGHRSQTFEV